MLAGLSIGLSMNNILEFPIGLTIGLLNERSNQYDEQVKEREKKEKNKDTIQGNANMLKAM